MIKNPTPRNISFFTALVVALIPSGVALFYGSPWTEVLLIVAATLIAAFVAVFYALEVFIYRKIKLIYKTIHSMKTKRYDSVFKKFDLDADPIAEVNKQVIDWASEKKVEIDELKKQELFRKEFLGNVSHELKTPIFNIQGYIHTLLDGAINDADVNMHFLRKAAKSTDRLCDLVEDLVSISQLETGELKMEMERFDVNALTKEVYESIDMKAAERNFSLLIKEGCDHPFFVYADKYRVRQVLVNLIVNSIKYGRENGRCITSFYDMDENILIEVSDDGEGIDQIHLPRLFERFYRVDKSRSREAGGNGLGLAIVKHIIEAHNQTINVRSAVGKGTTFGFTLKKASSVERTLQAV